MADDFGRDVIWIDASDEDRLVLCHRETGEQFHFAWSDIDEVIGMLNMYRMAREAAEYGGDEGANGEA